MAVAERQRSSLPSGQKRARPRGGLRAVGTALLGTVIIIWFSLATVAARRICFPKSYVPASGAPESPRASLADPEPLADPRSACGANFQNLALKRSDGLKLAAWLVPANKSAAVILLHGGGSDRRSMLPFLKVLHAAGYPALMIEEIDHSASDDTGRGAGYGWRERKDVLAAAAELRARGFRRIGALGVSQGAAAAIFAQAQAHALDAIVSDSAYADLGAVLRRSTSIASLNPLFVDTILWESGFWLGRSPDRIAPAAAAARLGDCALLVIHGGRDRRVPVADSEAIYAAARADKELWIVPSANHIGALSVEPDEYARRVISFFDRYLLTASDGASTHE